MGKKNKISRFFTLLTALLPEVLAVITVSVTIFYYMQIYQNFNFSFFWNIIIFGTILGLWNTTVYFFAMRPATWFNKSYFKKPEFSRIFGAIGTTFMLCFVLFLVIVPSLLVAPNSYRGAMLFIGCGTVFAFVYVLIILFNNILINAKKPNYYQKYYLKNKLVSIVAIVLLTIIGVVSWFFADYNPTLQHYSYQVTVLQNETGLTIPHESTCTVDIGMYKKSKKKYICRGRLTCGGKRLYGFLGDGVFKCTFKVKKGKTYIKGADVVVSDTDPAFSIDVEQHKLFLSLKHDFYVKKEFKGYVD